MLALQPQKAVVIQEGEVEATSVSSSVIFLFTSHLVFSPLEQQIRN